MSDGILIRKCEGSTITVDSKKVTKITIEGCENTTINLDTIILSSTLEIINSEKCNIQFKSPDENYSFLTVQIDNTKKTDLKFLLNTFGDLTETTIFSDNRCLKNSLTIPNFENDKEFKTHDIVINDIETIQHRTKISKKTNSVITVPVAREGGGYAVSVEEKKLNDEKDRKVEEKIEEYLSQQFKISKKEEKKETINPQVFKLQKSLQLKKKEIKNIENKKDETVKIFDAKMSDGVLIRKCIGSNITLDSKKVTKVTIENCDNSTILLDTIILSSTLEIINSESCNIVFKSSDESNSFLTLQIDNSKKTDLKFIPNSKGELTTVTIISDNRCDKNSVTIPDFENEKDFKTHSIVFEEKETIQHRTKISKKTNSIITVPITREGGGYAVSVEEKIQNEIKDKMINDRIEQFITEQLNITGGNKKEANKEVLRKLKDSKNNEEFSFDDISKFDKSKLNKAETHVTSMSDVIGVEEIYNVESGDTSGKSTFSTSHSTQAEIKEHFDSIETLEICVDEIAKLINNSKHLVVYTGAGISTSANIPDYRGPKGVWTLRDKGMTPDGIEMDQAFPTYSHYALVELMSKGILKYVVSTNVDGLHRRSGIPKEKISELHGNSYKEYCHKCGKEYLRYFDTFKTVKNTKSHLTGRTCSDENCKGQLKDTIIHFGESLPISELSNAEKESKECDLALVLGTSMRVQPACILPSLNCGKKKKGDLVIVNLQITPFDDNCKERVYAKTDDFMRLLMKKLNLENFNVDFDANQQ
eukprot:gene8074-12535_t